MDGVMERAERERQHFDQLAEGGHVWWGSTTRAGVLRQEQRAELLLTRMGAIPAPRCLELGCGTGDFAARVLARLPGLSWVGVDVSSRCIEVARRRLAAHPAATFEVTSGVGLPFRERAFDVVCGNAILHHLDLSPALVEARRVLRPGGLLWFAEPNMLNPHVALQTNVRWIGRWLQSSEDETAFVRWRLAHQLAHAGFGEVQVRPFDWLHPATPGPLIALARRLSAALDRIPLVSEFAGSVEVIARAP